VKRFAMGRCLVRVLLPKVMGWLGGIWDLLPERLRRRDQYRLEFDFKLCDSTCSIHFLLEDSLIISDMLLFSWTREGSAGSWRRKSSRRLISGTASCGRPGMKFLRCPDGMHCLDADSRASRKTRSPCAQDRGGGRSEMRASVMAMKRLQSAKLKLV
jgi:hypothetical protein